MKTVLLIGGTGNLGTLIGRELLRRGAQLRLLVRAASRSKVPADLAQAAEIVEDEEKAFQGVSSVVSAVQGGPETIVDAQLRFLRAARHAGVRRFIASDYSMNLFTVGRASDFSSIYNACDPIRRGDVNRPTEHEEECVPRLPPEQVRYGNRTSHCSSYRPDNVPSWHCEVCGRDSPAPREHGCESWHVHSTSDEHEGAKLHTSRIGQKRVEHPAWAV
jgi:hypothetical protein